MICISIFHGLTVQTENLDENSQKSKSNGKRFSFFSNSLQRNRCATSPRNSCLDRFFYNTCAVVFLLFNIALSHKPMIAIESFYRIHGHLRFILGLLFLTFVTTMKRGSSSLSKVCQEFVFFATTHVTCCQLRWFAFCHITGIVNTSL